MLNTYPKKEYVKATRVYYLVTNLVKICYFVSR